MTDNDTYTHDGKYRERVGFECELSQPYDPSDDEEGPITDDMLARWAGGNIMHWKDAKRVAAELLARRQADD